MKTVPMFLKTGNRLSFPRLISPCSQPVDRSRISRGGANRSKDNFFPNKCMKMEEFRPRGASMAQATPSPDLTMSTMVTDLEAPLGDFF